MVHKVIGDDLEKFFDARDFGVVAVVNGAKSVNVIMSERYLAWDGGGRAEVETQPVEVLAPATAGLAHDDALVINGESFVVIHLERELDIDRAVLRRV